MKDLVFGMDELQRKKLSNEETDSVFIVNSNLIDVLNSIKKGDLNETAIKNSLKMLKDEFSKSRLYIDDGLENFDIFASSMYDSRKSRYIGSRSHRENEKNKFKILNINKNINEFDFTEKLRLNYKLCTRCNS